MLCAIQWWVWLSLVYYVCTPRVKHFILHLNYTCGPSNNTWFFKVVEIDHKGNEQKNKIELLKSNIFIPWPINWLLCCAACWYALPQYPMAWSIHCLYVSGSLSHQEKVFSAENCRKDLGQWGKANGSYHISIWKFSRFTISWQGWSFLLSELLERNLKIQTQKEFLNWVIHCKMLWLNWACETCQDLANDF